MSTAAQSAAALVAIVGGFLVSRVIALTADRRAADIRQTEARSRIALLDRRLDRARKELAEWDASQLYWAILDQVLQARGKFGALELLARGPMPRRDDRAVLEILRPKFDAIAAGFELLEPLFEKGIPSTQDVQEIVRKHGRRRESADALRHVYEYLQDQHDKEQRRREQEERERKEKEREEEARRMGLPTWSTRVSLIPQFELPDIQAIENPTERAARLERRQQLLGAVERIEDDLSDQHAEESLAQRIAASAMTSTGIWGGFLVLLAFAVTGIVVPLWTLGLQLPSLTGLHRSVIVGLFLLGLVLLMSYLGVIIRRLRKESENAGGSTAGHSAALTEEAVDA